MGFFRSRRLSNGEDGDSKAAGRGVAAEGASSSNQQERVVGSDFEFDPNQTYEQSIENRFGDKSNSGGVEGVRLSSVFGAAPKQNVSSGRVAKDASRRIGGPMKPNVGYQPSAAPTDSVGESSQGVPPQLVQARQTSFLSGGAFAGGAGFKTVQQGAPSFCGGSFSGGSSGSAGALGKVSNRSGGGVKLPRPF
jgi:hypothetical protein